MRHFGRLQLGWWVFGGVLGCLRSSGCLCFRVGVWRFVGVKVFFVGWRDEFVAVV